MLHVQNKKFKKTQFKKQIFEPGVQPMDFVCIDLIGEFHPPSLKGNKYALTAVCMLRGFTFCIPMKNKSAEEVITPWRNHISFPFGVCRNYSLIMGWNLKMSCLIPLQSNWVWRERSTHHHTGLNQMVILRVFIISYKHVYLDIFLGTGSGIMSHH